MLLHLLGGVVLGSSVGPSCCNTGAFSRSPWVGSLSGGEDTKLVPTECHCPIQPPACGRRTLGDSIVLSCPVLCSGPQWGIPLTSQAMWTLVSIHPHTGHFPECVPYCIFCHPGGPEVPPSKTVPKVGDLGQHGLDLEKDPVCP